MTQEEKINLSKVRMERARECLEDARINLDNSRYKNAANRSYYAAFHAMRAVLALDSLDFKRHSGVISEFRRRYIKNGAFPLEMSAAIRILFDARSQSDYDDFFVIAKEDVEQQVQYAVFVIQEIGLYLEEIWNAEN